MVNSLLKIPDELEATDPAATIPQGLGATATTGQPTGLGEAPQPATNAVTPGDPGDVAAIAASMMGRDSPLMRKAAATGLQHANRRGLLNSSLAGQAAQSAMLDHIVPMASQTSEQGFGRGLQERQFEFEGGETQKEREFRGGESQLEREFKGGETQKERDLKLDIVGREEVLQRERMSLDEAMAAADRTLKGLISDNQISANDRRGAESMINNAYRDYENALQSIMSNPDLPAEERNSLLRNAKNMLTAKIDYATELYGAVFDWPENPFQGSGGSGGSDGSISSGGSILSRTTGSTSDTDGSGTDWGKDGEDRNDFDNWSDPEEPDFPNARESGSGPY